MANLRQRALARERLEQLRLLRSIEKVVEKRVAASIKRQGAQLANEYKRGKVVASSLLATEQALLLEAFRKHATQTARLFGGRVIDGKKEDSPYMVALMDWIDERALTAARNVTNTTVVRARRILKVAADEGLGVVETARRLQNTIANTARNRALVIARTEMHNASQEGALAAAYSLNQTTYKVWIAAEDDRTREEHSLANGQRVLLDEQFMVGGEALDRPGDGSGENSINCRCVMSFEVA